MKLLEDAPSSAYFILCTTEPEKLIKTIKGRCTELVVKALNEIQMLKLLKRTVRAEGKTLDPSVYEQIIQDSLGLPRNAFSIVTGKQIGRAHV